METEQTASYVRWSLAASATNTTNYYVIRSDTTVEDKNICNIFGPPGPSNLYRLPTPPPPSSTPIRALQILIQNKLCQNPFCITWIVERRTVNGMSPWPPFPTESETSPILRHGARYDQKRILVIKKSILYSCPILIKLEFSRRIL